MEFQSELSLSHGYYVNQTSAGDGVVLYNVMSFQSCSSTKARVLTHDEQRDYISCSCGKFEFEGIPCRHMLAFFRINQIFQLPEKYILKRWTRNAKIGAVIAMDDPNSDNNPMRFLMLRHSTLSHKASLLIDDASLTIEGTKFLDEQLSEIHNRIREMNITSPTIQESQRKKSLDKGRNINDPSRIRTKGCGKRLQSSKEKSISKSRICRGCGLRGVSHDKRNCPNLQNRFVIND